MEKELPVRLYLKDNTVCVDAVVRHPKLGNVQVTCNTYKADVDFAGDYNSNDRAFEVVDAQGVPIFQLQIRGPVRLALRGLFVLDMRKDPHSVVAEHRVWVTEKTTINPIKAIQPLTPIFRYPSWKHPGEYAPTKPAT